MKSPVILAVVAVVIIIVGGALLKGFADQGTSDPTSSVLNGAPRGLLGLHLLLRSSPALVIDVITRFDEDPAIAVGDVVLVAPPERSAWTGAEVKALVADVERGAHLVVACDDEDARNGRLKALLIAAGVECYRADVAIGDESVTLAVGALHGDALYVRGTGRVRPKGTAPAFSAWSAGPDAVVVKRSLGAGSITVLGSATVIANDGLAEAANAAFALRELKRHRVLVDERHHRSRSRAAVLMAAAKGAGPITGLFALVTLVPLSLLALVPRPGDPPRADEVAHGAPAAEAAARALAALLTHARAR